MEIIGELNISLLRLFTHQEDSEWLEFSGMSSFQERSLKQDNYILAQFNHRGYTFNEEIVQLWTTKNRMACPVHVAVAVCLSEFIGPMTEENAENVP